MKWFKRIAGVLIALQSIGFISHVVNAISLYLDGYDDVLGKAIFMGFMGLAFLVAGVMLFKSTLEKEESQAKERDKASMKKFGFGFLYFLAISMGILLISGIIIGGIAGVNNPENAAVAGQEFGRNYASIIYLISFIISSVGTYLGLLPGTKMQE